MLNRLSKKPWVWLWISVLVLVLDQGSKYWAHQTLAFGQPYPVLPFFNFTLNYNPGAAFSFLGSASGWQAYFFMAISLIVAVVLLLWLNRLSAKQNTLSIGIALILGGAIGNLIDRIRFHYVIDFFDFHLANWHYATFNVADSAICIGVFLLMVDTLFFEKSR